jgi:hypothetical protein
MWMDCNSSSKAVILAFRPPIVPISSSDTMNRRSLYAI